MKFVLSIIALVLLYAPIIYFGWQLVLTGAFQ